METKLVELTKTEKPSNISHPMKPDRKIMHGSICSVHVINAQAISDQGRQLPLDSYAVRCLLNGQDYSTSKNYGQQPIWNEILTFDINKVDLNLKMQLVNTSMNSVVGETTFELSDLS